MPKPHLSYVREDDTHRSLALRIGRVTGEILPGGGLGVEDDEEEGQAAGEPLEQVGDWTDGGNCLQVSADR